MPIPLVDSIVSCALTQNSNKVLRDESDFEKSIMCPEPLLVLAPMRAVFSYELPEPLRVVHFFQVSKLMDDDVVDDRWRHHHQLPVEAEVALA